MESDSRGLCGTVEDARLFLNVYKKDMSGAELYLDPSEILRAGCLKGVELLFRCLKKSGNSLSTGPLEELYTREFDEDQVWEQMQLTNEPALLSLHSTVQKLECGLRLLVSQPEEKCGGTGSMGQEDGVAEVQWSHSDGMLLLCMPDLTFVCPSRRGRGGGGGGGERGGGGGGGRAG